MRLQREGEARWCLVLQAMVRTLSFIPSRIGNHWRILGKGTISLVWLQKEHQVEFPQWG